MRGILPLPPRLTVRTRYQVDLALNNMGFSYANVRYEPTYCYDVNPSLGSTAMPFFTEVMLLYRFYRTKSAKISVQFVNKDASETTCYVCPVNFDPGANTSSFQQYLSNPNSKRAIASPLGGMDRCTIHHHATTAGFAGSRWLGDDDLYSSNGSVSPPNNWYFIVGIANIVGLSFGCTISVSMDVTFVAFEENTPSS